MIRHKSARHHLFLTLAGPFLAASAALAGPAGYPFRLTEPAPMPGAPLRIMASNNGWAPVLVTLQAAHPERWPEAAQPHAVLVPPHRQMDLAGTLPRAGRGPGHAVAFHWSIGAPTQPDPAALYRLPFASSQPVMVSQAFGGLESTHNTPQSRYAIDFSMPRGTPVVAARRGTVVLAIDRFGEGSPEAANLDRANMVEIMQPDGTLAEYVHLLKGSVTVRPGQQVQAGQRLGRSGNSGYSSAPHLHFGVQAKRTTQNLSIPVRFKNDAGQAFTPQMGQALPPTQAAETSPGAPAARRD